MSALSIKTISFQDPLRDRPIRENFDDIQTAVNDNDTRITNLSAGTSGSETVTARDNYSTLDNRLTNQAKLLGNGVVTDERTLDACDADTYWTAGTGATALATDTTNYVEGSTSLKLGKSGTGSATVEYEVDFANTDFENMIIYLQLRIADAATLADLSAVHFDITPDSNFTTNYKRFTLTSELAVNWVQHAMTANSPTSTTGTVADDATILKGRLVIVTNAAGDTITSGNMNVDWVYYTGNELRITAQATPDMTVKLLVGQATLNGTGLYKSASENSGTITAPSANPRYDIVTIDINNDVRVYTGVEAASPAVPDTPTNHLKLADIYHRVGSTSIQDTDDSTNSYIIDRRAIQAEEDIFYTPSQQRRQVFTSSGTWTKPAGVSLISFTVVAGGGNGGDGDGDPGPPNGGGGGGGGGGAVRLGTMPVVTDVTVTVGAASADSTITDGTSTVTSTAGGDGTNGTWGTPGTGGVGGAGGGYGAGGGGGGGNDAGGAGGAGGGHEVAGTTGSGIGGVGGATTGHGGINCYNGGAGGAASGNLGGGGGGGSSYGGDGGAGGAGNNAGAGTNGSAGGGYGAGGGGGGSGTTTQGTGGAGSAGLIIIEWFE